MKRFSSERERERERERELRLSYWKLGATRGDVSLVVDDAGDKCDVPIFTPMTGNRLGEMASNSHGGLIAGLVVSIVLILTVIAALLYYRRRISHLKSELAHVQYIADPSSAPGDSF